MKCSTPTASGNGGSTTRTRVSLSRSPTSTGSATTTGSTMPVRGLRADRGYPPQARLRPCGAVLEPGDFPHGQDGDDLLKKTLGFRSLLSVISVKDTKLVKGQHGRVPDDPNEGPLVISSRPELLPEGTVQATDFKGIVLDHVFGK